MAKNINAQKYSVQEILNLIYDWSAKTIATGSGSSSTSPIKIMDAAGNDRGANVDSNNRLSVYVANNDTGSLVGKVILADPNNSNQFWFKNVDFDSDAGTDTISTIGIALPASGGAVVGGTTTNPLFISKSYSFQQIGTATTTTVKSGAGIVHTITINSGTAGAVTVYDNTAGSGTIIFKVDSTATWGTFTLDAAFSTGLTVVTATAVNVTVTYK